MGTFQGGEYELISKTNRHIEELKEQIRLENEKRRAFSRMVQATDRILWRLEEMNRDGIKTVPESLRAQFLGQIQEVPFELRNAYRDSESVQEILDSIFEVQHDLFAWRNPEFFRADEDEELDRAS